jgi:hypothetical protein
MIYDMSPAPSLEQSYYTLHCSRGTLPDAFPGLFRNRSEALRAAFNLLKCPNWTRDMWLRLDEPNGHSFGTDEICRMLSCEPTRGYIGQAERLKLRWPAA